MVKSDNPNPDNAKLSPGKRGPDNRAEQPGHSSNEIGNEAGQKAATQTGGEGTHDQGGKYAQ